MLWGFLYGQSARPLPSPPVLQNDLRRYCWVCVLDRVARPALSTSTVPTIFGSMWVCRSHEAWVCGRCLKPFRRDRSDGLGETFEDGPFFGLDEGNKGSVSCSECRSHVVQTLLVDRREPPVSSNEDEAWDAWSAYVWNHEGSAERCVSRILELRWVGFHTGFRELVEQVRIDKASEKVRVKELGGGKADKADKRALWLAMHGMEDEDAETLDEADLDRLARFEVGLEDDDLSMFADEDDEDEDEFGLGWLTGEEEYALVDIALARFGRAAVEAGYWVSPDEHSRTFLDCLQKLANAGRTVTTGSNELYRPLLVQRPTLASNPIAMRPYEAKVGYPAPRLYKMPPVPRGTTLVNRLETAYFRALTDVLRPAFETLVVGLSGLAEPGRAADELELETVLAFVRTSVAWERGGGEFLKILIEEGERKGLRPGGVLEGVVSHCNQVLKSEMESLNDLSRYARQNSHPAVGSSGLTTSLLRGRLYGRFETAAFPSAALLESQARELPAGRRPSSSSTQGPLIGPVLPGPPPGPAAPPPVASGSPQQSKTDTSDSPSSHSSRPSRTVSTPPTSTSPSPETPKTDDPKQRSPAVALAPPRIPQRIVTPDPRPISQTIPFIPLSSEPLGSQTVDFIRLVWWRSCEPLRRCCCPICLRAPDADGLMRAVAQARRGREEGRERGGKEKRREGEEGLREEEGREQEGGVPSKKARTEEAVPSA